MKGTSTLKEETRRYSSSREAISGKYAAARQQSGRSSKLKAEERNLDSAKVSLLDKSSNHPSNSNTAQTSGLISTWQTLKKGLQNFKDDIGGQTQQNRIARASSSESLDDIFQRLKQPSLDQVSYND